MAGDRFSSGRSGRSVKVFFSLLIFILLAALAQGFFRVGSVPDIRIEPGTPVIGKKAQVRIEVSAPGRGLTDVKVEFLQGNNSSLLWEKTYTPEQQFSFWGEKTEKEELVVEVGKEVLPGLREGTASIRVTAGRAGTWLRSPNPVLGEVTLPVKLTPPSIQITSTQTYVAQGGCEAVVYRVGESAVRDGVRAGSWWFRGYPLPGGGKQDRFAIFAVPFDMGQPDVKLAATDAAGNEAEISFIDKFFPKSFRSDVMAVSDSFMAKVVPAILAQTPDLNDRGSLLDNYLAINREVRLSNAETVKKLSEKSNPGFFWTKPFLMMPNGKVMAAFADRRNYQYQGRNIDNQTHLGIDLASVRQAPIPAANDGVVLFAGFLGIYGNAVLIDHGFGLTTIYGHLSSISVAEGQKVSRGDVIGKTGETGLAGGDHLHFCTVLHGLPVNPVEWSDGHWIEDRIKRKLGSAMPFGD